MNDLAFQQALRPSTPYPTLTTNKPLSRVLLLTKTAPHWPPSTTSPVTRISHRIKRLKTHPHPIQSFGFVGLLLLGRCKRSCGVSEAVTSPPGT